MSHDPSEIILYADLLLKKHFLFALLYIIIYYYKYLKQLSKFFQDSFNEYKDQKISIYLK